MPCPTQHTLPMHTREAFGPEKVVECGILYMADPMPVPLISSHEVNIVSGCRDLSVPRACAHSTNHSH